jgi:predicted Holliday junction resolvase-like endonuclease
MVNKLIQQLTSISGLKVECPSCGGAFSLKKAKLLSMYEEPSPTASNIMHQRRENAKVLQADAKERRNQLALDRKRKPLKISSSTEATNFGQRCEQIIPAFSTFPYSQSDCRILFKPVDYVVFEGVYSTGRVEAIKLVELKTGGGNLTSNQRQVRDCIIAGKVAHEVIGQ